MKLSFFLLLVFFNFLSQSFAQNYARIRNVVPFVCSADQGGSLSLTFDLVMDDRLIYDKLLHRINPEEESVSNDEFSDLYSSATLEIINVKLSDPSAPNAPLNFTLNAQQKVAISIGKYNDEKVNRWPIYELYYQNYSIENQEFLHLTLHNFMMSYVRGTNVDPSIFVALSRYPIAVIIRYTAPYKTGGSSIVLNTLLRCIPQYKQYE